MTWAGWKADGGGYVVVIRHSGGMRSTYNHNSKVLVEVGKKRSSAARRSRGSGPPAGPPARILTCGSRWGGRFVNPMDIY